MLSINAQIKSCIDLVIYRKNQITKDEILYKSVELDLEGVSNTKIIEVLKKYPAAHFIHDEAGLYLCYSRVFTLEEKEKEDKHRISNMKYQQNKINKYIDRKPENKEQVFKYLEAKQLLFILD
jgi:hypothetical protein